MLSSSLFLFFLNIAFARAAGASGGAEATEPQSLGPLRIGLRFFAAMNNNGPLSVTR